MPHLSNCSVELLGQPPRSESEKGVRQCPVVPQGSVPPAIEPLPEYASRKPQIAHYRACVVQLVRATHEPGARRYGIEMRDVGLLALPPRRLWLHLGIGAGLDNIE